MTHRITMPALSPTMEHGTLVHWLVKEGDAFKTGDVLAEVETDKATLELEATDDGRIARILVGDGTEGVAVGAAIADYSTDDKSQPTPTPGRDVPGTKGADSERNTDGEPGAGHNFGSAIILASPLARRLAKEQNIDLSAVRGTGPRGRVLRSDIEGARADSDSAASSELAERAQSDTSAGAAAGTPHEVVGLSGIRRAVAQRMEHSKKTIPHAYLTLDVFMDAALRLREDLNLAAKVQGNRHSINDLLAKAMAMALAESPAANVQFDGNRILKFSQVDLAVAVAVEGGLVTPVIRKADTKHLTEISAEMRELADRARGRRLKPEEYSGGTASLSNLGMMGIKQFEAIINPPHAIILAVGAVEKRPAVVEDRLAIAHQMTATTSFDHRAMDGNACAAFLRRFKEILERPLQILLPLCLPSGHVRQRRKAIESGKVR